MVSPFDRLQSIKHENKNNNVSNSQSEKINNNYEDHNKNIKNYPNNNYQKTTPPPVDSTRIATGIKGFDQMIGGGFKRGSINLLTGGTGTGKTTFAIEFLLNGIFFYNQKGIYISFDEEKKSIFDNMKSFGWNLDKLEEEGKFLFVNYTPEQLMKILNEGGGLLDNLVSKTNADRLVIDPISTFLLMSSTDLAKRSQLNNLFKLFKRWNVTSIITNESTPIKDGQNTKVTPVTYESDSIIQLFYSGADTGEERERKIEVYKMRGTNHMRKMLPFSITQNGININLG